MGSARAAGGGGVNAEASRTAATEEEATAPVQRGLRERRADEANREKRGQPAPAGKRIVVGDESDEDENKNAREFLVVEEDDEPSPPLVLYPRTTSTGAQCDARPTGADTAVQVRMDADEDSVEPRVVLRINVVDDRPIDEPST